MAIKLWSAISFLAELKQSNEEAIQFIEIISWYPHMQPGYVGHENITLPLSVGCVE